MENDRVVNITFTNVTYKIKTRKAAEKKTILNSISGCFKAGELTAIMGPSGAGKSSLMNILTGFTKGGVKGSVKFGNTLKYRKLCCYILQDDIFFPWFTVKEVMIFATTLKISNKSMSFQQKQNLILNILDALHLLDCKETKCLNLSGGQKKRLSIALELVDNPPVIFLDEPTTGLDSSSSLDLVKLLKELALSGRTIVCTIHQPSASIYLMFNHIYVIDKGICIYQGTPQNTVEFFNSVGLSCPAYHNPADYFLEVITCEHGNYTDAMIKSSQTNEWRLSNKSNEKFLSEHAINMTSSTLHPKWVAFKYPKHIYPPPEWIRLWLLISRCHVQFYRDWTVTHLKFILNIMCSILIGLIFGDSGTNATKSISNIGLFLIVVIYLWYTTMMPSVLRVPLEIATIKRETFNNWYKVRTYYLATIITSTPVHIIFATAFSTIIYVMTSQPFELERYVKYSLINIIITIVADGFGMLLGTITDPVNGTFIGAILSCFMLIFSGFLIMFEHMSVFMRSVTYASPQRYALESLLLAMYKNDRSDMICPQDEVYCHFKNAEYILKNLGMANGDFNFNVLILILQISLFKGLAFFTLKRALRNQ